VAAVNKVARVTCYQSGPEVTIPAEVMALVHAAAPTRVRTIFAKANYAETPDSNATTFLLGRAIAGFTTAR
jgi:hypothetical protein